MKTGKVYFGYLHLAFLGPESTWAAEASECAAEQGKFWEYHDQLYANQAGENQGAFSKDHLKELAQGLNLEPQQFANCLDSGKYSDLVENQTSLARKLGITSTPAFVINGQIILGAQPFEVFQQVIEEEIKK